MVLGVVTVTFVLIHAAPGDPVDLYLSREMEPEARQAVLASLGLERPLPEQYLRWLGGAVRGDLGWSISHHRPVRQVIAERLPLTLQLTLLAFAMQLAAGMSVGALAAARRGRFAEAVATGGTLILYSLPLFWLAALLIAIFSIQLGWLPSSGARELIASPQSRAGEIADRARHLILPVICLGLGSAAFTARFVRSGLLTALAQDYATAARSRGAGVSRVLWRHALRNALPPVIASAGLSLPFLFAGSVLVEQAFSWPGMGSLSVEAVLKRDYPVVLALQMLLAALVVAGSFAADVGLKLADPRLREPGHPRAS